MGRLAPLACAWVLCMSPFTGATAQPLSPLSVFQNLSAAQRSTTQGKLSLLGPTLSGKYSLGFSTVGHPFNVVVFRPYYRAQFEHEYAGDGKVDAFSIQPHLIDRLIAAIASVPSIADGDVDKAGIVSFSLSAVIGDSIRVFESVVDTTGGRLLFRKLLDVFGSDSVAESKTAAFGCYLGLLPGGTPRSVTSRVSIRAGPFRRRAGTDEYAARVTITNTSSRALAAPLIYVFQTYNPPECLTCNGTTCLIWPSGSNYMILPVHGSMKPGERVAVEVRLSNPEGEAPMDLIRPQVFSGPGFR